MNGGCSESSELCFFVPQAFLQCSQNEKMVWFTITLLCILYFCCCYPSFTDGCFAVFGLRKKKVANESVRFALFYLIHSEYFHSWWCLEGSLKPLWDVLVKMIVIKAMVFILKFLLEVHMIIRMHLSECIYFYLIKRNNKITLIQSKNLSLSLIDFVYLEWMKILFCKLSYTHICCFWGPSDLFLVKLWWWKPYIETLYRTKISIICDIRCRRFSLFLIFVSCNVVGGKSTIRDGKVLSFE